MRDSLIFYRSFAEGIKCLDPEDQLKALWDIIDYALDDKEPEEDGLSRAIFNMAKPQIDKNNTKYQNGCKGGRPKNQTETETKPKQNLIETKAKPNNNLNKTKQKPNDNDNVNDNVNVNENENVNVNKRERDREKYYPNDDKLDQAFRDYVDMRKKIKSPMTDRAITLAMNKLKELAAIPFSDMMDNDLAIEILNQSTMNNWKGLFPLKENNQSRTQSMAKEVDSWIKQSSASS